MAEFAPFDRNVAFLVHEVARLINRAYDRRMKPLGLTRAQWNVLAMLSHQDGVTQSELADTCEYGLVALGKLLDRLEDKNWIERRSDPKDRRVNKVHLTARAEGVTGLMKNVAGEMADGLLAGLSERETDRFIASLNILKTNLQGFEKTATGKALPAP